MEKCLPWAVTHPPPPGYPSNCAVNGRSLCVIPESTEFPPGMLPGAKLGMYFLFFLVEWEFLCFTLKDVSVRTGLILRGSNSWPVGNQN